MSFSISSVDFNYYQSAQSAASVSGANSIAAARVFDIEEFLQTPGKDITTDEATLSPGAQLLKNLQNLQKGDLTKFRQILTQITSQLNDAAQLQAGNPQVSSFLNSLTSQFQQVLETGSLYPLQQGVLGQTGNHGHHHHAHAASTYNSTGQTQATSATSTGSSQDPLQALFATIQSEVSSALNPTSASSATTSASSSTTQPTISVIA